MKALGRLHLGLTPWDYDATISAARVTAQATRAEALGYESFWLPEHHFSGAQANPSPLLLLAAVAAVTKRLQLATTSLLLPVRHPLHVAAEVAVLDHLSGGRVILGLGRGFQREMFQAFDIPTKEKRDRFEAALALILDAWAGKPVTDGEGPPVTLSPLPLQYPHPPLWVAAFGPKALAQAGRLGLPYVASPLESLERLEANYAAHRAEAGAAGHSDSGAVPVLRTVFVHDDPSVCARVHAGLERQAAALARSGAAAFRRAHSEDVDDWALIGEPARVADAIALYRERIGVTHLVARVQVPGATSADIDRALEGLAALRPDLA
jgi:alkanesulfonate monooxygenase SsuD/methylene tetrahydromethanopterin reductase-like flavin-dependent oxidoreductase (luciferase family)